MVGGSNVAGLEPQRRSATPELRSTMSATQLTPQAVPIPFPLNPTPPCSEPSPVRGYQATVARTPLEVLEAQRLRYRIFAEEKGATIDGGSEGLDIDPFDAFCRHILVRDASGRLIGTTRALTAAGARRAGGFYSETEFDLSAVLRGGGRFLEIGRTCIHPLHRNGAAIATLWSGLGSLIDDGFDRLIGCASIDLDPAAPGSFAAVASLVDRILVHHASEASCRVVPKIPLPTHGAGVEPCPMPPLLKAYLRLGAVVCGPAYWDADFHCADLLVLVRRENLQRRYARHFLGVPAR